MNSQQQQQKPINITYHRAKWKSNQNPRKYNVRRNLKYSLEKYTNLEQGVRIILVPLLVVTLVLPQVCATSFLFV
jgi:hypothetical protein